MKKKNALDKLLETGRISQSTHEIFNKEFNSAIAELDRQRKDLLEKMNTKIKGLEEQTKTLEVLLANLEIQHVAGEIDEDVYQHEATLITTGLETTKRELNNIKEAYNQLLNDINTPMEAPTTQEPETTMENKENESLKTSEAEPTEKIQKPENTQIPEIAELTKTA